MGKVVEFSIPVYNATGICLLQNAAGAGNLILNGPYCAPYPGVGGPNAAVFSQYSPRVAIFSANNLSALSFTIVGVTNGISITEVILAGPNNATIYTDNYFDIVLSVSVSGAGNGIEVGTGQEVRTKPVLIDTYTNPPNIFCQVTITAGTCTYTANTTLDDIFSVEDENISSFGIPDMTALTQSFLIESEYSGRFFWVSTSLRNATNTLDVKILQPGL